MPRVRSVLSGQAKSTMPSIASDDIRATFLRELWDTTRMRLLVEIGRRGSLSGAADAIGIGQPSASQHLKLLETAAGQRLVERSRRGSRLTEAGEILASHASRALAALSSAEEELGALSGLQTGTIHLGASTVPGVYLLPETLGCFRRDFPAVVVEVEIASSDEILHRLRTGRVRLALVGAPAAEGVELRPLIDDELVGVARPGTLPLEDGVVAPSALESHLLLSREPGSASQSLVDSTLARAGIRFAGRMELGASEAIKRVVREGLGVALLSRFAVAEEVERGELERFRIAGVPPITRPLSVATAAGRELSPAESTFVGTLTRCCATSTSFADACVGPVPDNPGSR